MCCENNKLFNGTLIINPGPFRVASSDNLYGLQTDNARMLLWKHLSIKVTTFGTLLEIAYIHPVWTLFRPIRSMAEDTKNMAPRNGLWCQQGCDACSSFDGCRSRECNSGYWNRRQDRPEQKSSPKKSNSYDNSMSLTKQTFLMHVLHLTLPWPTAEHLA